MYYVNVYMHLIICTDIRDERHLEINGDIGKKNIVVLYTEHIRHKIHPQ